MFRAIFMALLASMCFSSLVAHAAARARQKGHEGHELVGWVPQEVLERPVPLRQGIGNVHEAVTTSSPQAQVFYDQGLAYLNSFMWTEAARSFHEALRLDPQMAMAYLGLSYAYLGFSDVPAARAAFEKARTLESGATEREGWRIEIRARQLDFVEDPGNMQKFIAYRKAIGDALAANPADPWFWILRGFSDEGNAYAIGQNGKVDTIAFYEIALMLSPDNSAAHHYLTHTYENLGQLDDALEHAKAYARLAPAIPHAHHMLGHVLRRDGRIADAIEEFQRAEELESAYYRSEDIPPKYDLHHAHNLSLLAMCYQSLGQMKKAEQRYREAFALPAYTDVAEFNRREWPAFLLDRGRPEEALEASQPLVKSPVVLGRFAGYTLSGRVLVALGRMEEAKKQLSLAEQELKQMPAAVADSMPDSGALRAEILLREGNLREGEALMKQMEQKILAEPGPDAWNEGLFKLDSMAKIARQVGDWELAEFTALQITRRDPHYAGGHYALGLAVEHKGDVAAARLEFASAERLWDKADPDLPELQQVRQKVAAIRRSDAERKAATRPHDFWTAYKITDNPPKTSR